MSNKETLIKTILDHTAAGNITWKPIYNGEEDELRIDQFNIDNYYQEYKFDGFVSNISDQKFYILKEKNPSSKLNNYKNAAYVTNNEGRIVSKITDDQLNDKGLLKALFTIVYRMVDDADSNIDSLISKVNKIGKL